MIFKTYDKDLDGISNKLELSKKGITDWGKQIGASFTTSTSLIQGFHNALHTVFTYQADKKNWKKNEAGEIVTKDNINSYIPELTDSKAPILLKKIQNSSLEISEGKNSWTDYFTKLEGKKQGYLVDLIKNTEDLSKLTGKDLVKANQAARAAAIAHNEALRQQTLGAKASKAALQALSTIGNMLAMWAISEVISDIVEITQASEKAKELGAGFKSAESDIEEYKAKISELHETINDNQSSFYDVSEARKSLMQIQDEMIEKYGTEKGAINDITDAINGQIDALDNLNSKAYFDAKNSYNQKNPFEKAVDFINYNAITGQEAPSKMDEMTSKWNSAYFPGKIETTGNEDFDNLVAAVCGFEIETTKNIWGEEKKHFITSSAENVEDLLSKLYQFRRTDDKQYL